MESTQDDHKTTIVALLRRAADLIEAGECPVPNAVRLQKTLLDAEYTAADKLEELARWAAISGQHLQIHTYDEMIVGTVQIPISEDVRATTGYVTVHATGLDPALLLSADEEMLTAATARARQAAVPPAGPVEVTAEQEDPHRFGRCKFCKELATHIGFDAGRSDEICAEHAQHYQHKCARLPLGSASQVDLWRDSPDVVPESDDGGLRECLAEDLRRMDLMGPEPEAES